MTLAERLADHAVIIAEDLVSLSERQHGFDMDDAWDIAAIASFFGLSNRMANVTSMRPNDELYSMRR